jgi:anti-sigma regulatory factor (Ser/Thr protein kinase)/biotin operon repressor
VAKIVKKTSLEALLAARGSVSSGELAKALGVSRQTAHAKLRRLVAEGRLMPSGSGRALRYEPTSSARARSFRYPVATSAEDRIVRDLEVRLPVLTTLDAETSRSFSYVASEMLNNAIDHSGGRTIEVAVNVLSDSVELSVADDGVGAFERVRSTFALDDHVQAAAELTKGKVTSMAERHSGEGIFFSSRVAQRFELHANGHLLIVDAGLDDTAVLAEAPRVGTHVRVVLARPPTRTLREIFDAFTEDFAFVRTRTVVKLFGLGRDFLSRSEAKRLLHGLERFHHVVLDFRGVPGVGQAFADEVFRVWARAHPGSLLEPVEMNDDVRFFVERARRG